MKKLVIFALLYYFNLSIYGQNFIQPNSSLFELEYKLVSTCQGSYYNEILAFEVSNLIEDIVYEFTIDSLLSDFDSISFLPVSQDWERVWYSSGGHQQHWRWKGDDYESDNIEVGVKINQYQNVELGLKESINIVAFYRISPSSTFRDVASTEVEIVTSASIYGDFLHCSNPVQFELKELDASGTASWEIIQNSSSKASGSGVNASASNISTGQGIVEYTVAFGCGLASLEFEKDFWYGVFNGGVTVSGQAAVCPNSFYSYRANVTGGHDDSYTYTWADPGNWTKNSQWEDWVQFYTPSSPDYGTLTVSVENDCGSSNYQGITVYPGYCGGYYMASPNPSSEYVEIDYRADREDIKTVSEESDVVIKVFSKMGTIKFAKEMKGKEFPHRINTSSLSNGEYIINIVNGKYTESLNIIVEH